MRYEIKVPDNRVLTPLEIDTEFARIQIFTINNDVLGLLLRLDSVNRAVFRFNHRTQIEVVQEKLDELNKLCAPLGKMTFNLSVYPEDNPSQQVNFTIIAENKGLLITKEQGLERVTVQVMEAANTIE